MKRHNSCVKPEDEVYVLGDCMLGGGSEGARNKGLELIAQLNGKLHIILGNHDSDARAAAYNELPNVVEVTMAKRMKYNGYHFYLAHYPTMTSNYDDYIKPLKARAICCCGHSHCTNPFQDLDKGLIYHVEIDAHKIMPVKIEKVISDLEKYHFI